MHAVGCGHCLGLTDVLAEPCVRPLLVCMMCFPTELQSAFSSRLKLNPPPDISQLCRRALCVALMPQSQDACTPRNAENGTHYEHGMDVGSDVGTSAGQALGSPLY